MPDPMPTARLDEISALAARLATYRFMPSSDPGQLAGSDVPDLIAEVRRARAAEEATRRLLAEARAALTVRPVVTGHCPACGRSSLYVGAGGYVTCAQADCPEPDAASALLAAKEAQ